MERSAQNNSPMGWKLREMANPRIKAEFGGPPRLPARPLSDIDLSGRRNPNSPPTDRRELHLLVRTR
jgi:hypothetical protein